MLLVPDTHFFLHFLHPANIPWKELGLAEPGDVRLLVVRKVAKEIDEKKFEKRGRSQDRAREYASKIADSAIARAPVILHERKPRVTLEFVQDRISGWTRPPELDPSWNDDVIVAEVLEYMHAHPAADVAVLTSDPGLIARATGRGIRVARLDGRGWELPPEKDPLEREVEKLRRENEQLRRAAPAISCELRVAGEKADRIEFDVLRHPPLDEAAAQAMLEEVRARHPRAEHPTSPPGIAAGETAASVMVADPRGGMTEFKMPSPEAMAEYHLKYDAWSAELVAFLRDTPGSLDAEFVEVPVQFVLENTGSRPAEGVRLGFEALGGFFLGRPAMDKDGEESPSHELPGRLRAPPKAPAWIRVARSRPSPGTDLARLGAVGRMDDEFIRLSRLGQSLSALREPNVFGASGPFSAMEQALKFMPPELRDRGLGGFGDTFASAVAINPTPYVPPTPKPQDRNTFYWEGSAPSIAVRTWAFTCAEFQHGIGPERFDARIRLRCKGELPRRGAVKVRLWASNLGSPFEGVFPIQVRVVDADVRGLLAGLLP